LDRLEQYQDKRDFTKTPEPSGQILQPTGEFLRFVVQEHHSRRLHWDFRLERDGVLKSWAVPKGIPLEYGVRHLAVEVEDHPLDYINFEGVIPPGNYGAGTVQIWDKGRYAVSYWKYNKLLIALLGEKLQGGYHLIRTDGNQWLIFRMNETTETEKGVDSSQ
jgi:bifunctional non-homologous end joining protein LigD